MPHLTVRGVSEEELRVLAPKLKQDIVDGSGAKPEHVKVFHSPVKRVDDVDEVAMDIYWISRAQEVSDKVAANLTKTMKDAGKGFVQVTFTEFLPSRFYEDGSHF